MPEKSSPSLITRFTGRGWKARFIEAFREQELVAGDAVLARRLAAVAARQQVPAKQEFLTQGGVDTDIYFILLGSVEIVVNGRVVAQRTAGQHVGEMTMLDPTATRSACVRTLEPTIVAKVSEVKFTKIANAQPKLWRNTANELAKRLKERNKFHKPPRSVPAVFIGSSSEGLKVGEAIERALQRQPCVPNLWTNGVFECSKTTIEDLMRATDQKDFAVLVLTADDVTTARKKKNASPRDNVVFELGLFMGALGRDRTYIVVPKNVDIKIPTDLLGVTCLRFTQRGGRSLARNLQPITKQIRELIQKHGPR